MGDWMYFILMHLLAMSMVWFCMGRFFEHSKINHALDDKSLLALAEPRLADFERNCLRKGLDAEVYLASFWAQLSKTRKDLKKLLQLNRLIALRVLILGLVVNSAYMMLSGCVWQMPPWTHVVAWVGSEVILLACVIVLMRHTCSTWMWSHTATTKAVDWLCDWAFVTGAYEPIAIKAQYAGHDVRHDFRAISEELAAKEREVDRASYERTVEVLPLGEFAIGSLYSFGVLVIPSLEFF
jgi:hypothetical protein